MIFDTHTNAKVVTATYKRTLKEASISRDRVSAQQAEWLEIPESVGTGKYNDVVRGWMDSPDWEGSEQRFTTADLPVTKR